jgi:spore germination protein YaaH
MNRRVISIIALITLTILTTSCKEVQKVQKPQVTSSIITQGWLYPDKTYDASSTIINNGINVLKPQYYNLNDDGTLTQITSGYNAYSAANVALVKQYSSQQYVTVSGNTAGMLALAASQTLTTNFTDTMTAFLKANSFTGIELDFESAGQWDPSQYASYKGLVATIGNALHTKGYKLMVDGPAISDPTYQNYYSWKWEDFNGLPVDALVVMGYDEMYDTGAGTPVASLAWLSGICQWMLAKITDHSRIVIGINAYGYHGIKSSYNITRDVYVQSAKFPGFSTATRDVSSGEMTWVNAGIFYDYSDSTSLNMKLQVVQNAGIGAVSVWALPGNQWFSQQAQPVPTPQPTPTPAPVATGITLTPAQLQAIAGVLTPDQIAAIKGAVS